MQIHDNSVLLKRQYTSMPRKSGLYVLFSSECYSVLQTTQQLVIALDMCSTPITFKYLKRRLKDLFGEIPSDELVIALTDAYEGGFISINGESKSRELEQISDTSATPDNVETIGIHLTDQCNFDCIYCFNKEIRKELNKELSTDDWKSLFDQLNEYKPSKYTFSGGEPLLREDITELAMYTSKFKNATTSLITNGSLVTDANAAELAEAFAAIAISIDSHDESIADSLRGKGAFKAANRALELLDQYNVSLTVNVCLTGLNIESFEDTSKYYLDRYKNVIAINIMKQDFDELCPDASLSGSQLLDFVDERYSRITEDSEYGNILRNQSVITARNGCGVGSSQIAIGPDGSVYPCRVLYSPELNCGNLLEDSFKKIFYESDILKKFRKADRNRSNECRENNCPYFFYCNGGCLAITYYKTGELKPWCADRDCQFFQKETFERIAHKVETETT